MNLNQETINNISNILERKLNMSYKEFAKLDVDEQQRLLSKYRKKQKKKDNYVNVMIGYGDCSTFIKVKKGERVMIRYGNIIKAGSTLEEEQQKLEEDIDNIIYSKPEAFVKKLQRNIKRSIL